MDVGLLLKTLIVFGLIILSLLGILLFFGMELYNRGLEATKNHKKIHAVTFLVLSAVNFEFGKIVGIPVDILINKLVSPEYTFAESNPLTVNFVAILFLIFVWLTREGWIIEQKWRPSPAEGYCLYQTEIGPDGQTIVNDPHMNG